MIAATLTWNGGVAGVWQNGGAGWLNGLSSATWNNTTPDAATFTGTSPTAVDVSGAVTVGNFVISSGSYTYGGSGTLTLNTGSFQVDSGLTAIISNALAGTAGLTKTGAGTLSLASNNKSYTGTTTINEGAIQVTDLAANFLGSSASATVALNGGAVYGNFSANKTPGQTFTIGASGGELRTLGSGRWLMTANKISGSGTLTLNLASATRFQTANSQSGFSGKWVYDGGGDTNRIVDFNGGAGSGYLGTGTGDDVLTTINSPSLLLRDGVILGTPSQGITLGGTLTRLAIAGSAVATVGGKISGSSGNELLVYIDTSGSCILSNQNNSWAGPLTLQANTGSGRLRLGASGVLPDAGGVVTINSPAILDLNGYTEYIGSLAGSGTADVRVASSSVTLGVGGNNTTSTFSGTLTNSAASSSLQLVKVGTGTLILSGTGIGHAGGTVISNGAIEISAAGAGRLGPTSSSAVTLNGGTLQGNFSTHTTVGNAITVGANGGTISNVGDDNERWQFSADQLYGSGILTLTFGSQNTRFTMASSQNNFTGKWVIDSGGNVNKFADLNYVSGNGFGAATGDDAITLEDSAGVLIRNGLAFGTTSQGITLGSGRAKISVASTSTGTIAGKVSGPAGNNVQFYLDNANSVMILSNVANSWLGTAQINAGGAYGTLRLGAAGVFPDAGGELEVTATARLDLNGCNETIGGLAGLGRVDNLADGTTATLTVGGNNSNATFSGSIQNNGVASTFALAKTGTGTQTLSSANSYSGATTVGAGALRVSHADALGSSVAGTTVSSGGALELTGGITVTSEPLTLNGTGVAGRGALLNISGNNTWQGAVQFNNTAGITVASESGDLKLKGALSFTGSVAPTFQGNGNVFIESAMNSGLTRGSGSGDVLISPSGSMVGDVTVASGATGAFKVEGPLTGNVTMNGGSLTGTGSVQAVTLNAGTLSPAANSVARLGMSALTLVGGAYQWNVTNATGTAGVNWDLLRVGNGSGTIDLSGAGTGAITVRVTTALATLPNFSHTSAGSWMIADGGSVNGFAASKFTVDSSSFTPGSEGGTWSVSTSGGDLFLNFAPGAAIDLAVSATDSPDPAPVGDSVTYTITITNRSASAAEVYCVTNRLAPTMTYVSSSDSGAHNAGVVTWTLSNLAGNGSRTITVSAYSSVQGTITNATIVAPRRAESDSTNNSTTNTTAAYCPSAGVVTNSAPTSRVATNGQLMTFSVAATNIDCNAPLLFADGLPSGALFTVVTNGYGLDGTFTWTPGSTGTFPVRFFSYNETKATSTVVTLIHVGTSGEPQTGGVPNSQTNWSIPITDLRASSGGNVTVVWDSVDGITYDVYSSSSPIDGGASWSIVAGGREATGASATANVSSVGSATYYQVVPQGAARTDRSVWGVVRPSLSSFSFLSPPLVSDRSFADSGEFGSALAAAVPTGTKVHIATDGTPNWQTLERNGSGQWRTSPGGTEYTTPLGDGQGVLVEGASGSTPVFSGTVGNTGASSQSLVVGFNIIGLSEGKGLSVNSAFSSFTPVASYDENEADQVIVQNANGSWRRLVRLPTGVWYDMSTGSSSSLTLMPGQAYYYIRRNSNTTVTF